MSQYDLNISDDTVGILLSVGAGMKLPASLSTIESLELVIDALANSLDAQIEVATSAEGTPLQMQEAVEAILNPNIGQGTLTMTDTPTLAPVKSELSLQDIINAGGMHGKQVDDPLMQESVRIVYNQLDRDSWDTPLSERLVTQTVHLLQEQLQGRTLGM